LNGGTIQYCIDAAIDKATLGIAGPLDPDECQKIDMQRSGDAFTIDFACTHCAVMAHDQNQVEAARRE